MSKPIHVSGKRKTAIARATITDGKGNVKINNIVLSGLAPRLFKDKINEPLILAGNLAKKIDISVKIIGGGTMAQAEAGRLAIARAIVAFSKSKTLEKTFGEYDRNLLVADVRRKEACKPNDSKARAKRQKSYR